VTTDPDRGDGLAVGLAVEGLTVRYGGAVAVNNVTVRAPSGRITGLIGPNGAGKTTTFNACSGLLRPSRGLVSLFGEDVSRLGPAARARRGLGRTFQRVQLFRSMTVRENLVVGREAALAGANPLRQLVGTADERRATTAAVDDALDLCQLGHLAGRVAGSLPTGQQRLVELARACVSQPKILLLDEPSSGLDVIETERFGDILELLVRRQALGILLVEHDMGLVMRVCGHLYVLDFGVLIFEGSPVEVQASDVVRGAYLGAEDGLESAELAAGVTAGGA
jgi:ABC-type branched-subunit amino acid transport system ATPase component